MGGAGGALRVHEAGPDGGAAGDVGVGVHEGEVWGAFGGEAVMSIGRRYLATSGDCWVYDGAYIRTWSLYAEGRQPTG